VIEGGVGNSDFNSFLAFLHDRNGRLYRIMNLIGTAAEAVLEMPRDSRSG
jgi:hypothetical protein